VNVTLTVQEKENVFPMKLMEDANVKKDTLVNSVTPANQATTVSPTANVSNIFFP